MAPVVVLALATLPLLFLLAKAIWVTVSSYYLTPARIRRILSRQGVHGPSPRLLIGNLRDVSALVAESTAGDMGSLSHDIVGRLLPHYVLWSKTFGEFDCIDHGRGEGRRPDRC
jgi:cytokinin trans-hydroxylase